MPIRAQVEFVGQVGVQPHSPRKYRSLARERRPQQRIQPDRPPDAPAQIMASALGRKNL